MIKWPGTEGGIQGEFSGQVAKGIHQVYNHTISCDGWISFVHQRNFLL
jgi:hypothetical protein